MCITWFEAADHCAERGARLPTEAEWEYAARGPDNLIYPWGNTYADDQYITSGDLSTVGLPAGMSWVGAHHLIGNAYEWVNDLYGSYSSDSAVNPQGPASGDRHVVRGSGWASADYLDRSSSRASYPPELTDSRLTGLRCARDYEP